MSVRQSDGRVPGRSGEPRVRRSNGGGPPPSFGRPFDDEPIQVPVAPAQPVRIVDGQVVLEVAAQLVIGQESAQAFYDEVKQLTMLAIRDGYAAAMGVAPGAFGADVDNGQASAVDGTSVAEGSRS